MLNKAIGSKKGRPPAQSTVAVSGTSSSGAATDLGKAEDAVHASGNIGIMVLAVRKDTAASTAADGDYHPLEVDSTGRLWVNLAASALLPASLGTKAASASLAVTLASDEALVAQTSAVSTAMLTTLASAATSAQLVAANAARKGLILFNTDANAVHIKYGTTAATTDFTWLIGANAGWEMPRPIYTGRIDAIWAADGAGSLYVTEL